MNSAQIIFCKQLSENVSEVETVLVLWKSLFSDSRPYAMDVKEAYVRNEKALKLLKEMKMTIEHGLLHNAPAPVVRPFGH